MRIEYSGRAAKFWLVEPTRWATCEEIPPDDREPHYRLAARVHRHAEAQEKALREASYARRWPRSKWEMA